MSEIATVTASPPLTEAVLRDALDRFGRVRLTVTGDCMRPDLLPGDTVLIEAVERLAPRFGNIVLALFPSGPRLHRLVWRPFRGAWRTKADRARTLDPPLARSQVLGTVVAAGARGVSRRVWLGAASLLAALARRVRP